VLEDKGEVEGQTITECILTEDSLLLRLSHEEDSQEFSKNCGDSNDGNFAVIISRASSLYLREYSIFLKIFCCWRDMILNMKNN